MTKNGTDTGNDVGALVKIEGAAGVVGSDDTDGAAGLQGDDGVKLPAFGDKLGERAQTRHLIVDRGSPAMARVERRWPLFSGKVVGVLRESRGGEVEIDAVRSTIERFRPSVGRET